MECLFDAFDDLEQFVESNRSKLDLHPMFTEAYRYTECDHQRVHYFRSEAKRSEVQQCTSPGFTMFPSPNDDSSSESYRRTTKPLTDRQSRFATPKKEVDYCRALDSIVQRFNSAKGTGGGHHLSHNIHRMAELAAEMDAMIPKQLKPVSSTTGLAMMKLKECMAAICQAIVREQYPRKDLIIEIGNAKRTKMGVQLLAVDKILSERFPTPNSEGEMNKILYLI